MYLSKVTKYLYFVTFHHCWEQNLNTIDWMRILKDSRSSGL